jgi:4-hydroxybenzoate polyprenyltransferase
MSFFVSATTPPDRRLLPRGLLKRRSAFMLLFSLTLVSFVVGIVGGVPALRFIAIFAGFWRWRRGTPTPSASS